MKGEKEADHGCSKKDGAQGHPQAHGEEGRETQTRAQGDSQADHEKDREAQDNLAQGGSQAGHEKDREAQDHAQGGSQAGHQESREAQDRGQEKDAQEKGRPETQDGGHALAGYTMSKGAGLSDVWLLKLSADGELLWERTYGEAGNEWARALVELPDGGLALAGDTYSTGAGASDVLVLKIAGDELKIGVK